MVNCQVMTKNEEWFEKFEDVPEKLHTQLGASLFPPTPQEAAEFNLHKWYVIYNFRYLLHAVNHSFKPSHLYYK